MARSKEISCRFPVRGKLVGVEFTIVGLVRWHRLHTLAVTGPAGEDSRTSSRARGGAAKRFRLGTKLPESVQSFHDRGFQPACPGTCRGQGIQCAWSTGRHLGRQGVRGRKAPDPVGRYGPARAACGVRDLFLSNRGGATDRDAQDGADSVEIEIGAEENQASAVSKLGFVTKRLTERCERKGTYW